jgi:formylglycine-generating enzyme required for sulfatase activity
LWQREVQPPLNPRFLRVEGDAWQWTEDCYRSNYTFTDTPLDGSAWVPKECKDHVIRGGSWANIPSLLRAAARHPSPTDKRYNNIGFRVGRTLAIAVTKQTGLIVETSGAL